MGVLIDASFYLALRSQRDPFHRRALKVGQEIMGGAHGQAYMTDYVAAEILNFAGTRLRSPALSLAMLAELTGKGDPPWMTLAFVDQESFASAASLFSSVGIRSGLSFTDCTSLVMTKRLGVSLVASFDRGFDGFVGRLS